jgi:hypothetical protein
MFTNILVSRLTPYVYVIIGIIIVHFDVIGQVLISLHSSRTGVKVGM